MNSLTTTHRTGGIIALITLTLFVPIPGRADDFTDDQYKGFDRLLGDNLTALQADADKNIKSALDALDEAYEGGYANDPRANDVRRQLVADAEKLKADISKLGTDVTSTRPSDRDPATMLFLLSREQAVSFKIYRWVRDVTEMADLAHVSSGRRNPTSGEFFSQLKSYHKNLQDTLSGSIQKIAILLVK